MVYGLYDDLAFDCIDWWKRIYVAKGRPQVIGKKAELSWFLFSLGEGFLEMQYVSGKVYFEILELHISTYL